MSVQILDCESSSNIRWLRYYADTLTLEVDFKTANSQAVNSTYEYRAFSAMDWAELSAAESKGRYFAEHIRLARDAQGDAKFPCRRINK